MLQDSPKTYCVILNAMSAQDIERTWWGDCGNTFHEEQKQLVYAEAMGLKAIYDCGHPPSFDLEGRNVLDIGGGPISLLLKCINRGPDCAVVEPCEYPPWVWERYHEAGIAAFNTTGEEFIGGMTYDEAWCYNVMQHVEDPAVIAENMRRLSVVQRVFEWIGIPAYDGHPHMLDPQSMNRWFGGPGSVAFFDMNGAVGHAWYGVFVPA